MVGFLFLAFFWYIFPTFENHLSCNELILLIVIQKNVPSLPTTVQGELQILKRPIQQGLDRRRNKKKDETEQKWTEVCARVSQE